MTVKSIFLIGMMGSGKSTIGRMLAKELHLDFWDTDHELEHRENKSIADIFREEGEVIFRQKETALLEELVAYPCMILATGGGVVLSAKNRQLLKNGNVIYLHAEVKTVLSRMKSDKSRPLLQNVDMRTKLTQLYTDRDVLYRSVADHILQVEGKSIPLIIATIKKLFEKSP